MKLKFKFISLALAGTLLANAAFSQVQWGIRGGVNFSNMHFKSNNTDRDGKLLTGFNAGVTADINLADEFYIQPGLLYTVKGTKGEVDLPFVGTITSTRTLGYVELPVNFLYKPDLGTGRLLLGAGPYFAYGVTGKDKYRDVSSNSEISRDINWGKDEDLKPFDAGAGLLFGYEFANGLSAQLNAQLGLANIAPDNNMDAKIKNTLFGISLGYKF